MQVELQGLCGGNSNIVNSYNIGNISGDFFCIGGIIGYTVAGGINFRIENVYNMGNLEICSRIGGIAGGTHASSTITMENVYWKKDIEDASYVNKENVTLNGKGVEESYLKSKEFVNLLNENIGENDWKKWKLGENGYPEF